MNAAKIAPGTKGRTCLRVLFLAVALVLAFFGGKEFYELRHYEETVVSAPGLTEKKMLSDYLGSLKGTWMDTPIFVYDSGVKGGSVLYMANVHPYEPATSLGAYILMENIKVTKGKVYVIPQGNRSGSTTGMLGNAYPKFFRVPTAFGEKKLRIGDRGTNPLDQWPDPFTYVNFPSKQNLAYQDIRNMNRTYPGRKDGTLTERASYAIMELIRKEKIDLAIDTHEASLMYPVVSTYVAHEKSFDIATMAAMTLTAGAFRHEVRILAQGASRIVPSRVGRLQRYPGRVDGDARALHRPRGRPHDREALHRREGRVPEYRGAAWLDLLSLYHGVRLTTLVSLRKASVGRPRGDKPDEQLFPRKGSHRRMARLRGFESA